MMTNTWGLIITIIALVSSYVVYQVKVPTPFLEWFTVLYYVNFFSIASYANEFYDSVHEDDGVLDNRKQ